MSNDSARMDVCNSCISYLLQRFDRNLFVTSEPVSAVRQLKIDLLQCDDVLKRCREVHNPQLIADSILMLLRELNQCVMHEIYQDIVKIDSIGDILHLKVLIRQIIVKLCPIKFESIKKLFYLLNKASTSCDIPSAGQAIGESISPKLCFLTDSAYFSIRHKEDLTIIQPVIIYMINFYHDIFTNELRPVPEVINPNIALIEKDALKIGGLHKDKTVCKLELPHSFSSNYSNQSKLTHSNTDPVVSLNSTISSTSYNNAFQIGISIVSSPSLSSKIPDTTGWQWKIVESLVFNCVASSMKLGINESSKVIGESHITLGSKPKRTAQSLGNSDSSKSRYARTNKGGSFDNVSDMTGGNTTDRIDLSFVKRAYSTRRSIFKRLLSDLKATRNHIVAFEEEFKKVNNRAPRQEDRGPIESIYSQYSSLKRKIRDFSATEIERIARGYITRNRLCNFASKVNISSRQNIHVTDGNGNMPPGLTLTELYAMYRDIRSQKHELKRRLKQFDIDFEAKYHRAPEKNDKEVVRALYQKYQALKIQLDGLQEVIETSHGRVPDELLDRDHLSDSRHFQSQQQYSRATMSNASPLNSNVSNDNIENRVVMNTAESIKRYELNKSMSPSPGNLSIHVHNINQNNTGVSMTIEQLQQEKTNLWTYLKAYEKDFTRKNGRQVTSTADITPVVREYQRYKEIKLQLISLQGANNVN